MIRFGRAGVKNIWDFFMPTTLAPVAIRYPNDESARPLERGNTGASLFLKEAPKMRTYLTKLIRWKSAYETLINAGLVEDDNATYHKILGAIDKFCKRHHVI